MFEEKCFATLRIPYFFRSFINPFVYIAMAFSDSSFNSFLTSTCVDLFEVTYIFDFFSL